MWLAVLEVIRVTTAVFDLLRRRRTLIMTMRVELHDA